MSGVDELVSPVEERLGAFGRSLARQNAREAHDAAVREAAELLEDELRRMGWVTT